MSIVELESPKPPAEIDYASVKELHRAWLLNLEQAFEAAVVRALRATLRKASASLGNITAQGEPLGEPYLSLDDLAVIAQVWEEQVLENLLPKITDVMLAGAQGTALTTSGVATVAADVIESPSVQYLSQANNRLMGIGNDAWSSVREGLVEGMQAGEGIPQLKRRVRDTIDVVEARARVIARTEVIGASNAGSFMQAKAAGVKTKTWLSTTDARTRPAHNAVDGATVGFDEPFAVGGSMMQYPHDPAGPASQVANCRCTLLYDDQPMCVCTPSWVTQAEGGLVAAGASDCACSEPTVADAKALQRRAKEAVAIGRDDLIGVTDEAERALARAPLDARARYTTDRHRDMNGVLRGMAVEDREEVLRLVGGMDDAFDRYGVVTDQAAKVYRGISANHPELSAMRQPGTRLVEDGFTSTTIDRGVAEDFVKGAGREEAAGIVLEIRMPGGQQVLAGTGYEQELILPRGRSFRSLGEQPDGSVILELEP